MALSIEKSGKTVQRAINEALDELGLSADDVVIEVLDEGEIGLLGLGRRPATVRITVEGPDQDQDSEATEYYGDDEDYAGDPEMPEETETIDYVASILSGIGIHGRISSYREDDTLHIDVTGQDCGSAIGRRGETLDAIQYLASLVANKVSETRIRVIVDIAGYRRRRQDTLIGIAQRTAKKVARSGEPFNLEPMNPAERRIIHATLQDFPGVTTYSEGENAQRYVVIAPESVE
ncbi:MAG: RNA-binding cell elongation regulator Jag/EloR [Saccharofermentanales bacterium]|jgi:spoIIIJ-associated protein|nr:protein jag [Clostridiaceae bacterium]